MPRVAATVVVVLAALVALVMVLRPKDGAGSSGNGTEPVGGSGFTVVRNQPLHRVLLEAEAADEIALPAVVASAVEGPAGGASKQKCCYIGPEKWNDRWKKGQVEGEFRKGHEEARNPGFVRLVFEVPATADYVLWLRAYWVDDCGNSVDISIDGSRPGGLTGSTYGKWLWQPLRSIENDAVRLHLEQGKKHTLVICNREDDLYFDQILLLDASQPTDPVVIQE